MIKKVAFLLVIFAFIAAIVFYLWKLLQPARAELEITSVPAATVYLNGKAVGKTPYKNYQLRPGNWQVKLVASKGHFWERKVTIPATTRLVIHREFNDNSSRGRVIYLTPSGNSHKAGCLITSIPPKASVTIDGNMKGTTPLAIENLDSGEHHFILTAPGFQPAELSARTVKGYRLVAEVDLGLMAKTALASTSPAPKEEMAVIKETPTGWLRVRQKPTRLGKEIGRVIPKHKYRYLGEKNGWLKIEYQAGKEGWVSGRYASH